MRKIVRKESVPYSVIDKNDLVIPIHPNVYEDTYEVHHTKGRDEWATVEKTRTAVRDRPC